MIKWEEAIKMVVQIDTVKEYFLFDLSTYTGCFIRFLPDLLFLFFFT